MDKPCWFLQKLMAMYCGLNVAIKRSYDLNDFIVSGLSTYDDSIAARRYYENIIFTITLGQLGLG